jgi:hypothetical protein
MKAERATRQPWRPTKYQSEFCQQIIDHCSKGMSVSSFGAVCNTTRDNLYAWAEQYPEFNYAMKRARLKTQSWWEEKLISHAARGASGGQVAATIFALKNFGPDDFRERIEHTGKDGAALALEVLLGKLDQEEKTQALQAPTIDHEPPSQLPLSSVSARASHEKE